MSSIWSFILVWGVWLITPILIDGVETVSRVLLVKSRARRNGRRYVCADEDLPSVSVIVPAHNEGAVIDRCINSIKAQDYPHGKLEIIVVDDGSTDGTSDRVEEHVNGNHKYDGNGNGTFRLRGKPIRVGPFRGTLALIKNGHEGKAHALNAGIEASSGEIVVNVDSDVVLASNAIRSIARGFLQRPNMGAATGNIEIDWEMLEARDKDGRLVLDDEGGIQPRELDAFSNFLARAQFLEYLASFDLGRRAQGLTNSMYTLAGACSAFRREVLIEDCRYQNATVSEDTCLTFRLHRRGVEVGFLEEAKVYLEPVVDWDALYAQRARWARGQMEVCGRNSDGDAGKELGAFGTVAVPKMLLFDHTLAFPRLIWAPLLLFFPVIGYPMRVVTIAAIGMYAFYLGLEAINIWAVHTVATRHARERIEDCIPVLLLMPLYRFIVFHFRLSGYLVTLTEEQQWTVTGPVQTAVRELRSIQMAAFNFISVSSSLLIAFGVWTARNTQNFIAPGLIAVWYAVAQWITPNRRW